MKVRLRIAFASILIIIVFMIFYFTFFNKPINERIKIGIVTWVGYGPLFIAKDKDYFSDYGLDVEIVTIEDTSARDAALISGEIKLSISTMDTFANQYANGLPAKCVLKLDDSYGADGIVANIGIKSLSDLRGKSIGYDRGSTAQFFLFHLLKLSNIDPNDIISYYMTAGDAGAAFMAKKLDAAVTWEPWLSNASSDGTGHILVTSKDFPGLISDIMIVNSEYIVTNRETINNILLAWFKAVDYYYSNTVDANSIMAKGLGIPLVDFTSMVKGVRYASKEENIKYFGINDQSTAQHLKVFASAQSIWLKENIISSLSTPNTAFDLSFLHLIKDKK